MKKVEIQRRAFQRTTSIRVLPSGVVRVNTNRTTSERYILQFVEQHRDWIDKQFNEHSELRKKNPPKRFVQGEGFLYMGKTLGLDFQVSKKARFSFSVDHERLICHVPESEWSEGYRLYGQPQIVKPMRAFFETQARIVLAEIVKTRSEQMNLYPTRLTFRAPKTRWGSCSSEGVVSLNWKLIAASPAIMDYIVVHELSHLKHQDHSDSFWNLVESYIPTWREQRSWLKENAYVFDFLSLRSELHGT